MSISYTPDPEQTLTPPFWYGKPGTALFSLKRIHQREYHAVVGITNANRKVINYLKLVMFLGTTSANKRRFSSQKTDNNNGIYRLNHISSYMG